MENFYSEISREPELVRLLKDWQKNPKSLAFVPLAEGYRRLGLFKQALEILDEGLQSHPDLSSALIVKGKIYFSQKRFAACLDISKSLLRRNSGNIKAHRLMADVYLHLGQKHRALQALGELLALHPSDTETLRELEALEAELAAIKPAEPVKSNTLRSDQKATLAGDLAAYQVQDLQGFRVLPARLPEVALDIWEQDLSKSKAIASAVPALEEPQDESGEPTFATRTIAELYIRQGHKNKALKVLEKILSLDPEDLWAQNAMRSINPDHFPEITTSEKSPNKVALAKVKFLERLLAYTEGAKADAV